MRIDAAINTVDAFLSDYFDVGIPDMHATDIIEILIIAFFLYHLFNLLMNSRAASLIRGIVTIIIFFIVAALLQMSTILWIGSRLLNVAAVALIVVFQPEIRNTLSQIGTRRNLYRFIPFFNSNSSGRFSDATLNDIVVSCQKMSAVKTGALIVIEREIGLNEFSRTGIELDAAVSKQLIINIFEKNTPLHDGAVIIRGDRIVSATCYLPLSNNFNIDKSAGTRHRAALGLSEVTDALIIIVSEETGRISLAQRGQLIPVANEKEFRSYLKQAQHLPKDTKEGEENADG